MANKKRAITVFFNESDEDVYVKLMNMNKFLRAEFIRVAIKKMMNEDNSLTFEIKQTVIKEEKTNTTVKDIEENTNPFSID